MDIQEVQVIVEIKCDDKNAVRDKLSIMPSVDKNAKQLECVVVRGRWCKTHECDNVKIVKSSGKTWAWLNRSQKYGWKYSSVKKYQCEAMGMFQR